MDEHSYEEMSAVHAVNVLEDEEVNAVYVNKMDAEPVPWVNV